MKALRRFQAAKMKNIFKVPILQDEDDYQKNLKGRGDPPTAKEKYEK